ncbi:preprotein translocase subunit SecD [Leucobacter sp. UCD-THU]|uniref:protein translocase subunit SecD n=1 Tax=Leucobacter sp. UCD-THU TaxID=1292023 RepID=UPI0003A0E6CC|nr:protein translocase subunit SecD [Leucobacter sp. UCD-THU]EYT52703.1 preprotein translocase subunit SecD [Leucobacter sp. UCD-THU]
MASTPAVRRARRSLVFLLVLIVGLAGLITYGVFRSDATWTPKLALDLQGGTQILLAAEQTDGQAVSGEQLQQAVSIIRQRVDAAGVSEAEITTQGGQHISVSIPGKADEATLQRIEASAKLDFRPVLATGMGVDLEQLQQQAEGDDAAATPEGETADAEDSSDAAAADEQSSETTATDEQADDAETADDAAADAGDVDPDPLPTEAGDMAWITPALQQQFDAFSCDSEAALDTREAAADRPLITCDDAGMEKFILGPVELSGDVITDAVAQMGTTNTGATTGEWVVQITMNSQGADTFGKISTRLYGAAEPQNRFAFVLDGSVLSAPTMNGQILDGRPSISGSFTQESSQALADQLKFGALPMDFTVQSQEDISATLGTNQLQAGLLAGLIGLLLVVVYSIFQYRALGSLTIASLAIAAVLTYLLLTFFSWRQGYRLSLAGVAGIIVAVGFTADSFIVYFERIRDALRDGFSIESAVEHGWKRAFRTVLASDGVNLLAAVILFILAVGNVKGFAFTLGLTTLVDVLVVALFTHPMMTLLARTRFYRSGHPASGLDPQRLGAVYRGRAQFREPVIAAKGAGKKNARSQKEAERRQTIAERKAAEQGISLETANTGKES